MTLPGGPPDAAIQVQAYQQKLQEVQWELFNNPTKLLAPLIAAEAQKIADQRYEQRFSQHQGQQAAQSIIQQNSEWLFDRNPDGSQVQDYNPATGSYRPRLSSYGRYYTQQVQRLEQQGVTSPELQHQLAFAQLQNAILLAQRQQQQAPAQGQQQAQQFVDAANQSPPGVVTPPAGAVPQPQPPVTGEDLNTRMARAFGQAGITDQHVHQSFRAAA